MTLLRRLTDPVSTRTRHAPRARKAILFFVVLLLASASLSSCGGGATGNSDPPAPINIAGNWQFTFVSSSTGKRTATATGTIGQSGTAFSGTLVLTNACSPSGAISGTISGTSASAALTENGQTITITGSIASNGDSASGAYTSSAGACPNGDTGTWSGTLGSDPPVVVTPPLSSITTSQTIQFEVNASSATWAVDGITDGSNTVGLITASGLYAPPATPGIHSITATASGITSAPATVAVTSLSGTFSWRNDASLTGQNPDELALSPSTLSGNFGKLFACAVDGYVYAQPLYYANLNVTTSGDTVHHNVVFVATENDSVYAFDADASPCQTIWQTNFVANQGGALDGISTIPSSDVGTSAITPQIGITGTPVIDPSTNRLYVVAATKENGTWVNRLHALNATTGTEIQGSPVEIAASVTGTGDGTFNGHVSFNALYENQRPALVLSNGTVYIAYGSFDDANSGQVFHGWVLAYSYNNGTQIFTQTGAWNGTPNGASGAIEQSGAGPSVDASGNLYVVTGNGTFDAAILGAPNDNDYAQSLLRLSSGLAVGNYFTPYNQAVMNSDSPPLDLGASGLLLLPNAAGTTPIPHLGVLSNQTGELYLVNRDSLGGYKVGGPDNVVQELSLPGAIYGTPALWQGSCNNTAENIVYTAASGDALKAFPVANAQIGATLANPAPTSQSSESFSLPGASPTLSSNGSGNGSGIVWALDTSGYATPAPVVVHAYNACTLADLYNSSLESGDAAGGAVEYAVPTVANGKVYVGTQTELSVYGLLP